MNQSYPVPPPELLEQLRNASGTWLDKITTAYQSGADQELEACCADVQWVWGKGKAEWLRSMRRPKPPRLKEQALLAIDTAVGDERLSADVASVVRRALEQLPN